MGLNLWWVQNDGIDGHVWLSPGDMLSLREEMLAQGMAWQRDEESGREQTGIPAHKLVPRAREVITAHEIEEALDVASPEPRTLADRMLWQDWLTFLDGARTRGGILIR